MKTRVVDSFRRSFGFSPDILVRSPGRANIIGEHTDYLGGLCLPMAINLALYIAASKCHSTSGEERTSDAVHISSSLYPDRPLEIIEANHRGSYSRLSSLIAGLNDAGFRFPAVNIEIAGDLPAGAGLSSSAAFTAGVLTALDALFNWQIDVEEKIGLCLKSEHRAGTPCGLMDPSAVFYGQKGKAVFLDCFSGESEAVNIETDAYKWLIINSGVVRDLSDGRYSNVRTRMVEAYAALKALDSRIEHPRYLDFAAYVSGRSSIPEEHLPYLDHYYLENERVKTFIGAIGMSNIIQAGNLLFDSQQSLANNLHTNIEVTDWIVERLGGSERCAGARVTGAGFGGTVLSLVESPCAEELGQAIARDGSTKFGLEMQFWAVVPDAGIGVVEF